MLKNVKYLILFFIFIIMIFALSACKSSSDKLLTIEEYGKIYINSQPITAYTIKDISKDTGDTVDLKYVLLEDILNCGFERISETDEDGKSFENIVEQTEEFSGNKKSIFMDENTAEEYKGDIRINGQKIETTTYCTQKYILINVFAFQRAGFEVDLDEADAMPVFNYEIATEEEQASELEPVKQITVFLDPGHGKDSSSMTDAEKENSGWVQNSSGSWGEWRHWTDGEYGADCMGNDGAASQPGDCWYPIGNSDRNTEPDINLQNCLAAKSYLEGMGYNVVMSRETNNENPSITKRIEMAESANADIYVCIHSNAGGGSGSAYIALNDDTGYYSMDRGASYAEQGNMLGRLINNRIVNETNLSEYSGGCIDGEGYLILFQKAPMVCTYLEIGFFDNANDLSVLQSESDKIGQAIAEGIGEYFNQ